MKSNYGKRAKLPINHIDDCSASKYFLQLNLYRYLLDRYYGVKVDRMVLVSFHPNLENYFMTDAPIWEKEVIQILEDTVLIWGEHFA